MIYPVFAFSCADTFQAQVARPTTERSTAKLISYRIMSHYPQARVIRYMGRTNKRELVYIFPKLKMSTELHVAWNAIALLSRKRSTCAIFFRNNLSAIAASMRWVEIIPNNTSSLQSIEATASQFAARCKLLARPVWDRILSCNYDKAVRIWYIFLPRYISRFPVGIEIFIEIHVAWSYICLATKSFSTSTDFFSSNLAHLRARILARERYLSCFFKPPINRIKRLPTCCFDHGEFEIKGHFFVMQLPR